MTNSEKKDERRPDKEEKRKRKGMGGEGEKEDRIISRCLKPYPPSLPLSSTHCRHDGDEEQ